MDPLIAAQVYNIRFNPLLSRLPEEILLCVIDFLCDDVIALHCLRIVSRAFLRILHRQSLIWRDAWYIYMDMYFRGKTRYLQGDLRLQFRRLLQKDGRCKNCKRWNDAQRSPFLDDCKFRQIFRNRIDHLESDRLHCYACDQSHDIWQFSSAYQKTSGDRRCLGYQGSVQLCEHVQITWAIIKAHIYDWRQQQQGGDWQVCLNSFNIECHDASHDTRCTVSEPPTWPRARFGISKFDPDIVVLNLEWVPHSRIDALDLTIDGRIPASELRALFQRLRGLGPVGNLCPSSRPGVLPEMVLFSPSAYTGDFIYYKTGEDHMIRTPPESWSALPSFLCIPWDERHGFGRNGKMLDIRPHYPRGSSCTGISSQCLVISYEKDIRICKVAEMTDPAFKIMPTDHWLHAMDTQTYPHPQASQIRPQCRDLACINYYRRRRDYYNCCELSIADLYR